MPFEEAMDAVAERIRRLEADRSRRPSALGCVLAQDVVAMSTSLRSTTRRWTLRRMCRTWCPRPNLARGPASSTHLRPAPIHDRGHEWAHRS
jgi:hypothetical protein